LKPNSRTAYRVNLKDLASNRGVHVGSGLHGLHGAERVASGKLLADSGQVDEHNVTERVSGVGSDSNSSDITVNLSNRVTWFILGTEVTK
jgi:hypothetical protein